MMSFLDALTPIAQKRRNDIYEAFHNPDGTRKENVKPSQEKQKNKTLMDRIKSALKL